MIALLTFLAVVFLALAAGFLAAAFLAGFLVVFLAAGIMLKAVGKFVARRKLVIGGVKEGVRKAGASSSILRRVFHKT